MRSFILILCLSFALCGVVSSTPASAQSYALQSNPSYPQPGEPFTLSLQGQPQNVASISWYVNGVDYTQGAQQKEITLTYEALGESLSVEQIDLQRRGRNDPHHAPGKWPKGLTLLHQLDHHEPLDLQEEVGCSYVV